MKGERSDGRKLNGGFIPIFTPINQVFFFKLSAMRFFLYYNEGKESNLPGDWIEMEKFLGEKQKKTKLCSTNGENRYNESVNNFYFFLI